MPPTPRHPFDPATQVKDLKKACGTVCYGALVNHFGTDSAALLEKRVDGRAIYNQFGEKAATNKFRRWLQGRALPGEDSRAHALKRSGGAVDLGYWRDLPLWRLLHPEPPSIRELHRIIEGAGSNIRRILFNDALPEPKNYNHSLPVRSQTLAIRNLRSLDAFQVLLALARKGEQLEDGPLQYLPSACAFDILPYVLYSNRPLAFRWQGLFVCLKRIYWDMVYFNGMYFDFPVEGVESGLVTLMEDPAASLPYGSGNRERSRIEVWDQRE